MEKPFARRPEELGRVLRQVLARSGYARRKNASELVDAWEAAVGPGDVDRTTVAGYGNGVLTVEVAGSDLLMELDGFRKRELVRKVARSASRYTIRDIRFRLRPERERGEA